MFSTLSGRLHARINAIAHLKSTRVFSTKRPGCEKEGTRKDIHIISRVEFTYGDDCGYAVYEGIEYTDLFHYKEDN